MKIVFSMFILLLAFSPLMAQWECGQDLVDPRDGKVYKTVKIGSQCWMAENLNLGSMIPTTKQGFEMSDNGVIEKYCWDNDEKYCDGTEDVMKKGGFYEWMEAVNDYTTVPDEPVRGICPEGWHLPSHAEFTEMLNYLGGTNDAVGKLQVGGESGFECLMTGYRCTMTGSFRVSAFSSDYRAYFWTSTVSGGDVNLWEIGANSITTFPYRKSLGLSVRCILDDGVSGVDDGMYYDELEIFGGFVNSLKQLVVNFRMQSPGEFRMKIADLWGRSILDEHHNSSNRDVYTKIDVNDLSTGAYFLVIQANGHQKTKKFIVI